MLLCISSAQIALCVLCSLAGGEESVFGICVLLAVVGSHDAGSVHVQIPCMTWLCISVPAELLTISYALLEGVLAGCATASWLLLLVCLCIVIKSCGHVVVWNSTNLLMKNNRVCTQ
jgi:hypothetical protein